MFWTDEVGRRAQARLGPPAERVASAPHRRWARVGPAGVIALVAAAAAWVLRFNPTDQIMDPTGRCLWHTLTGINGPTCGGTRMFWYLLHADVVQAARHHLAALLAVPVILYLFIRWTAVVWFGRQLPPLRLSRWVYVGYGLFFIVYSTVLRNLPWPPFSWFDIAYLG
jgi:hypothetical protein